MPKDRNVALGSWARQQGLVEIQLHFVSQMKNHMQYQSGLEGQLLSYHLKATLSHI